MRNRFMAVTIVVLALMAPLVPAGAHGDQWPPDCNFFRNGPFRDNGTNLIYGLGTITCDYQHAKNVVQTQLRFSPSGNEGTYSTVYNGSKTTWDTNEAQHRGEKDVCNTGAGYFKVRMYGDVYNSSNVLVHSGTDVSDARYFACVV
ncbi:MAG TPA: hypothetical protein VHJ76_04815 [Actinomycetota bacterium]|nr:hypothetical protein [Actinomycetota bacterium]